MRDTWALTDGDGRYRIDGLTAAAVSLAADYEDSPRVARDVAIDLGLPAATLKDGVPPGSSC